MNMKTDVFVIFAYIRWKNILRQKCKGILTHLPVVPHISVSESGRIGSDNGLSPSRRQAII